VDFVTKALAGDEEAVGRVFPIVFGVLGLQLMHDLAHYASALSNKVRLGLPILLPSLQIGIFGSVVRFLDYPRTRKELFDVSIAGPLVGLIASLSCVLLGLDLTIHASPEVLAAFPQIPKGFFQSSFLLNELVSSFLHPDTSLPSTLLAVHPLFVIGVAGILANAYNFLPIGKLDGGRVAMAIAGRQAAASISNIMLFGLAVSLLTSSGSPVALFWSIYVSLFLRSPDLPPLDDVTPVASAKDDENKSPMWFARVLALLLCVTISAATILPGKCPRRLFNSVRTLNMLLQ
jgi:membrane-associated protease RseP (regulator of RpoE activity)